jgi:flagellar hook-basal body complex protein FliE
LTESRVIDPLNPNISPLSRPSPPATPVEPSARPGEFAGMLREQLERVNQVQSEADEGLQRVLTGQSQNLTEVFVTARKAEVAFSLLMEIRNKLVDAYEELRQLRV